MPRGPHTPSTSLFIRDYMLEEAPVRTKEVHSAVKEWCEKNGWTVPETTSISKKLWTFKRIGIIEKVGEEEMDGNLPIKRNIYDIVDDDTEKWKNAHNLAREMEKA